MFPPNLCYHYCVLQFSSELCAKDAPVDEE